MSERWKVTDIGLPDWIAVEGPGFILDIERKHYQRARLIAQAPKLKEQRDELLEACEAAKIALYHPAPSGCWVTGPLTGDPIEDLVICPGCRALMKIEDALTKIKEE